MKPALTDLRSLRAFAAVARHRSFSRAADELYVSQQSVSRTVAALEAELAIRLLERTTRSVELTPAGASLAADAERILTDVDVALERARDAGRGGAGSTLRLATTPAITAREVSATIEALRAEVPDVSITVDRVRPRRVEPDLTSGEVDVVLGRASRASANVEVRQLGMTRMAIAVPAGNRLAGREVIALGDLEGERLIVWSRRSAYTTMLLSVFADAGVTVEPFVATVVGADGHAEVAAGNGVALLPESADAPPEVVMLRLADPVDFPIVAYWRRWGARPVVGRFLEAAERALREPLD